MRVDRAAEEAPPGASDLESADLARAHKALQAVTDALATAHGFAEIVPMVLAIVARTFGVEAAGYFEHTGPEGGLVFLRYWLYQGRVLRADELLAADPTTPRRWIDGFTVPDGYPVGASRGSPAAALVIDHAAGTVVPEFDNWCRAHGWELELNVPCLIRGSARGNLVLCRASGAAYTPAEISLAETLATHLALAVEADRLAREVRERAVEGALSRERERAADARARELSRGHDALQSVTDALAVSRGVHEIVPAVLRTVARTFSAPAVGYFERTGRTGQTVVVRYWLLGDRLLQPVELLGVDPSMPLLWLEEFTVPPDMKRLGPTAAARAELGAVVFDIATETMPVGYKGWFCGNGWPLVLNVPCSVDGLALGSIVICRGREAPYTSAEVALGRGIGSQLALGLEADRLARVVRDSAVASAVARERARAAEERVAELARANAALRETANQLAGSPGLVQFLEQTLVAIARELGSQTAAVVTFDAGADAFVVSALVADGRPVDPELLRAFPTLTGDSAQSYLQGALGAESYAVFDVVQDRDKLWPGSSEYLAGRGMTSQVAFPIRLAGRLLGRISAAFATSPALTQSQVELVEALANQAGLAIELTRLAAEARSAAIAGERNALAREVHDTLAQGFSGIIMQLGAARDQLGGAVDRAPALSRVERLAREHLAEARRSIATLRPDARTPRERARGQSAWMKGLESELRHAIDTARDAYAASTSAAVGITMVTEGTPQRLPADIELELLRVAQAAIANALHHARARTIRVELEYITACVENLSSARRRSERAGVRIRVADDGCGFDPEEARPGHFGLVGMSERAARIGAALTVVTAPNEGTEVVVMWRPQRVS